MGAPRAFLLTPSKSTHSHELLFYKIGPSITHLESTLLQVFILKSFKSPRMNTYEKRGEGGRLWLTSYSSGVTPATWRLNPRTVSSLSHRPAPPAPTLSGTRSGSLLTCLPRLRQGHLLLESWQQPFKERSEEHTSELQSQFHF